MNKVIHYCWFGGNPLPKLAKKCMESWKKFLPDFEIKEWNEKNFDISACEFVKGAYENKKWAFVADYARTKVLQEYGGLYLDTDMEITKDITNMLNDNSFLGLEDSGYVAVGAWYEKYPNSFLTEKLLEKYQGFKSFEIEKICEISIPKLISEILEGYNLKKGISKIQTVNGITIYPREYFYPYSYLRDNNIFTENTCMIHYYDASWIPFRDKVQAKLVRSLGQKKAYSLINAYRKLKRMAKKTIKLALFPFFLYRKKKNTCESFSKEYMQRIKETVNSVNKMENCDYITFYNKYWFGVTSSTKELFNNLVDCGEIHTSKDVQRIANAIVNAKIKQIVFSSFAIGWKDLVKALKRKNPEIKIKTFWHGSNSQILDSYGWERNQEIIELHSEKMVDVMGTCKKSLLNFYKSKGYDAMFITNKVSVEKIEKKVKPNNDEVVLGIYAARCDDWRKNMYTQLGAAALINNAVVDMVPLNVAAKKFAKQIGLKIRGVEKSISREELLKRMSMNDVNLYITFSECAPMLPLESMNFGVPCITGNNHHYFEGRDLEKYVVVNDETNVEEIANKINYCIKNREKVIEQYEVFKNQNIEQSREDLISFLKK